ncbi:PLP-dependent aminotransferase family protein [Vibrio proteolyticus]|uniref:Putative GntR family transcriptional regulator n=1 Tax=Vibrio proteolyticus NBRC 13287 TaxID=1219065 RepID=U3A5F3_VIBPR|nr:PLP-dependent aminotransferase family protein [Vibrio proteolyticus]GAD68572.1 putative GntR family transcriptional regulator [Vibrio proteolyticus NBRC 13287]
MTISLKPIIRPGTPKYISIGNYLVDCVRSGYLKPGTRLPTHREFAEQIGVSVQTVSHAYSFAEKKGALESWVGNGTFVKSGFVDDNTDTEFMLTQEMKDTPDEIDMSIAHPVVTDRHITLFNQALVQIAAQPDNRSLIGKAKPVMGQPHHIDSGRHYLQTQGLDVGHDQLLLTNGACHGLTLALSTVVEHGDLVACGQLVDHGLISRSRMLGFKLLPLEMDEFGITPEAFEWACQHRPVKALCCTPSMANPNSAHMDQARREAIARLAEKYDIYVIEDDVYGALEPNRVAPLTTLIPQQAFYVTSFTKVVAPGMRTGYLTVPRHFLQHAIGRLAATSWSATPLPFEVAHLWIENGTLDRLIRFQMNEFAKRQKLASSILRSHSYSAHPHGQHIWLKLPDHWQSDDLVASAKRSGVQLTSYKPFVLDMNTPQPFVRISLGAETNRGYIKHGLSVIAEILDTKPPTSHFLV